MTDATTYTCDFIPVYSGIKHVLLRPKLYTLNGTVKEIIEMFDNEEEAQFQLFGLNLKDWKEFRDSITLGELDTMTPQQLSDKWDEFTFWSEDYWNVVKRVVEQIFHKTYSYKKVKDLLDELDRDAKQMIYHHEPWDWACWMAGEEKKLDDYHQEYLAIRDAEAPIVNRTP